MTSSTPAASRTVRASTPSVDRPPHGAPAGAAEIRPLDGLRPTMPQHEAGIRTDPPPSDPWATATRPAATAAAEPPLDPPGDRARFHGLRVGPNAGGSVVPAVHSSGTLVRPMMTKPAWRSRRVSAESDRARWSTARSTPIPRVAGSPDTSHPQSLTAIGTP